MNAIIKIAVLSTFLFIVNSTSAETKLNVNEVLKKIEEVYAKCDIYADTGYVRILFMDTKRNLSHF